jgi:ribosome-binding protein aMBF1 (putative translation factor)
MPIRQRAGIQTEKRLTIIGRSNMKNFSKAKKTVDVSVGESVRIMRELQELSQNELFDLTSIPQSTISAIEHDRINLGVERAKILAKALQCHPAVLVFPGWDIQSAA